MFLEKVREKVLLFDGAMGTLLQAKGLSLGECPEQWNLTKPEIIKEIHKSYFDAGADCVETNSFGGTKAKLNKFGLANKCYEFNKAAAELAREVTPSGKFVAASIGSTGEMLEPYGDFSIQECYDNYAEQMVALKDGGVDVLCIETMMDLEEAKIALKAAKENTNLPVIVSMTYNQSPKGYKTLMGNSISQVLTELINSGAGIIGSNCGNGVENMIEILREYKHTSPDTYFLIQPNAGLPDIVDGKTIYKETPEIMKNKIIDLLKIGVNIIGGCCGTTPDHIRAFREILDNN
ncbi:MAG TPA: homocysteine S-methyltransferase family protein [Ignavibacteria bacterium]